MKWIDSHCHLDFPEYDTDREEIIREIERKLEFVINVSTSLESNNKTIELIKNRNIYGTLGLHPHESKDYKKVIATIRKNINKKKIVAIGEIGLDYYKNYAPKDTQIKAFETQLEIAQNHEKSVVIHSRDALDEVISITRNFRLKNVVFHCFTGTKEEAKKVLDMGYYISFTGIITFKKSLLGEVVEYVPIDRILIETDSPFLAPEPHRGKRNTPLYVEYIGKKICSIKKIEEDEAKKIIGENTKRVFSID